MTDRLFVYGTLRRDAPGSRSSLMAPDTDLLGYGRMRGRLLDLGPFPAFVPTVDGPSDKAAERGDRSTAEESPSVLDEVYALGSPAETLARLDRYEGCAPETSAGRRTPKAERDGDRRPREGMR